MAGKKRVRDVPLYVWVRPDELEAIRGRMEEAGIRIHTIPSAELSRGRGAPRCMSMPLWREDP